MRDDEDEREERGINTCERTLQHHKREKNVKKLQNERDT